MSEHPDKPLPSGAGSTDDLMREVQALFASVDWSDRDAADTAQHRALCMVEQRARQLESDLAYWMPKGCPKYGAPGSRDVDVAEAQRKWDEFRSGTVSAIAPIKDSPCTSGAQALSGRGADEAEMKGDTSGPLPGAGTGTRTPASSTATSTLADKLHGMGDAAYCRAAKLAERELCLGEEHKIATGKFTLANLKALEEVRAEFGRSKGLWEAANIIRGTPSASAPSKDAGIVAAARKWFVAAKAWDDAVRPDPDDEGHCGSPLEGVGEAIKEAEAALYAAVEAMDRTADQNANRSGADHG